MKYTGNALRSGDKKTKLKPYDPEDDLVEAVNIAIFLNRPLLLRGKPGTGKSRLVESIAFEFHQEKYKDYLFEWNIKSSSKAKDGLYEYDHLKRLQDAYIQGSDLNDHNKYINLGPLGKAFIQSSKAKGNKEQKDKQRPIVLIDEIDKAEIDFPNDLLLEIEKKEFVIDELRGLEKVNPTIDANHGDGVHYRTQAQEDASPIIIITSNDERELSDAFLRRCVFHYIKEQKEEKLIEIVTKHLEFDGKSSLNFPLNDFVYKFVKIQTEMKNLNFEKLPYTSEMLDWIRLLSTYPNSVQLEKVLNSSLDDTPFRGTLIKTAEEWLKLNKKDLK